MDIASRELVRQRAGRRCEYCQIHEDDELFASKNYIRRKQILEHAESIYVA